MATKSIMKSITIRDKRLRRDLVNALENAKKKKSKEVQLSRTCMEVTGEDIAELFGDKG